MQYYTTSFPVHLEQPNISIHAHERYAGQIQQLLDYLEDAVVAGTRFQTGQTVQIGWTLVKLEATACGKLEIWEPDFVRVPIVWLQGVDSTLRFMTLQREVCSRIGVQPDFPSLRDPGAVLSELSLDCGGFVMERENVRHGDAGWLFRPVAPKSLEARKRSLYEIALSKPSVIPFLALPPNSRVIHSEQGVEVNVLKARLSSEDDDFLRDLARSPLFGRSGGDRGSRRVSIRQ